jgi:PPOX class probable F420-dependent enzyme
VAERLADPAIEAFLGPREIVVLGTVQADGSPVVTPMWFLYGPDALTMISETATQKVRNLRRDPRVCVVADAGSRDDARGVLIRGRAEFLPESAERSALVRALLKKYEPDLRRKWGGDALPSNRVLFRIIPISVRSWNLPGG